jgi:hypothetical protein
MKATFSNNQYVDRKGEITQFAVLLALIVAGAILTFGGDSQGVRAGGAAMTAICLIALLLAVRWRKRSILRVEILDDRTLQFHTGQMVESVDIALIRKLVLTDVDHEYYENNVVSDGKTWQWTSTASEADQFADAMLAINPTLPVVLKTRMDYGG